MVLLDNIEMTPQNITNPLQSNTSDNSTSEETPLSARYFAAGKLRTDDESNFLLQVKKIQFYRS